MSSLRSLDHRVVDDLVSFVRGPGYVLDFSDITYSQFFETELDIDIDDPRYANAGRSKGKRLTRFLQLVDDATALKALKALWDHRADIVLRTGDDPVPNAEARYLALVNRLGGGPATGSRQEKPAPAFDRPRVAALKDELLGLATLQPHPRGLAFEGFLVRLFDAFGMRPREPFRNKGEQIDGSFLLGGETYLLEAKWQNAPTGNADLHTFEGKLGQKAAWARGLFVSYSGFTDDGLAAFGRGKRTVCMSGHDLFEVLNRGVPLDHAIDRKVRRAAEDGMPHTPIADLF